MGRPGVSDTGAATALNRLAEMWLQSRCGFGLIETPALALGGKAQLTVTLAPSMRDTDFVAEIQPTKGGAATVLSTTETSVTFELFASSTPLGAGFALVVAHYQGRTA